MYLDGEEDKPLSYDLWKAILVFFLLIPAITKGMITGNYKREHIDSFYVMTVINEMSLLTQWGTIPRNKLQLRPDNRLRISWIGWYEYQSRN